MSSFCGMLGCDNKQNKFPDKSFYRLPAVDKDKIQGVKGEKITQEHWGKWLGNLLSGWPAYQHFASHSPQRSHVIFSTFNQCLLSTAVSLIWELVMLISTPQHAREGTNHTKWSRSKEVICFFGPSELTPSLSLTSCTRHLYLKFIICRYGCTHRDLNSVKKKKAWKMILHKKKSFEDLHVRGRQSINVASDFSL